jgi:hypothetical protein
MTQSNDKPMGDSNKEFPKWYALVCETGDCSPMYEHLAREGFPTVKQLRRGILLGCIAHALWLAANQGMFAHNHQWEGDTYVEDIDQGERWAVTFVSEGAVAVFYSSESERNPFPDGSPPYDQARYFQGMPDRLQTAKERALAWMINLDWGMGGPNAAITAAMWADGERFTANEPWEVVFHHSLCACHHQLLPLEVALVEWKDYFDLDAEGVAVLRSLYQRRLAATEAVISVEPWERAFFTQACEASTPAALRDDPGLSAARDALASVGVALGIDA